MLFCFALVAATLGCSALASAEICPGRLAQIAAVGTPDPTSTNTPADRYAVSLASDHAVPFGAEIVAVADGQTWSTTVPLQPLHDIGSSYESDRLILRFPAPVHMRGAYIRAVTTERGTASCPVSNVATLEGTARLRAPIVLPKPDAATFALTSEGPADLPRDCTSEQPAATLTAVAPVVPPEAAGETGFVSIAIDLRADSSIADTRIRKSSGYADLDRAALHATRLSTFRTQSFLCRPIASSFQYVVVFGSASAQRR